MQSGDLVKARAAFEQVVKLAPGSAEGHNLLGWVLFAQGQTAESIAQFRTALRLKPDLAAAHVNLANALVKSGDWRRPRPRPEPQFVSLPTTRRRTALWEESPAFALTWRRPPPN